MGLSWLLCNVGRHWSGQTVVPVVARGRVAGQEVVWKGSGPAQAQPLPRGGLWAISEVTQGGNWCWKPVFKPVFKKGRWRMSEGLPYLFKSLRCLA